MKAPIPESDLTNLPTTPAEVVERGIANKSVISWVPSYELDSDTPYFSKGHLHQGALTTLLPLSAHQFATAGQDGVINLWDTHSDKPIISYTQHTHPVTSLVLCDDEILSADNSGSVHFWSKHTGEKRCQTDISLDSATKKSTVFLAARSVNNVGCFTASGSVSFWNCQNKKSELKKRHNTAFEITQVHTSANKEQALVAGQSQIILYHLDSGDQLKQFSLSANTKIQSCVFYDAFTVFIYPTEDLNKYILLNVESGKFTHRTASYAAREKMSSAMVEMPLQAFSLSYHHVALLTTNNVQVLDVAQNKIVALLPGSPTRLYGANSSPDLFYCDNQTKRISVYKRKISNIDFSGVEKLTSGLSVNQDTNSVRVQIADSKSFTAMNRLLSDLFHGCDYRFNEDSQGIRIGNIAKESVEDVATALDLFTGM